MKLVTIRPGLNVRLDRVDSVRILPYWRPCQNTYIAQMFAGNGLLAGIEVDTLEEAEELVAEWTAIINGTDLGTRVPIQDLDAKATEIGQAIFDDLVSWGPIKRAIWSLFDRPETTFPESMSRLVRKHLGGSA